MAAAVCADRRLAVLVEWENLADKNLPFRADRFLREELYGHNDGQTYPLNVFI